LDSWRLHLIHLVTTALVAGCARAPSSSEPPLRPLLYTEGSSPGGAPLDGLEEWTDPTYDPVAWPTRFGSVAVARTLERATVASAVTPAAAMVGVVNALLNGDREALESYLFDAASLSESARIGNEAALRDAAEIHDATLALFEAFEPGPASRARPGGLAELFAPGALIVGRGRLLDGTASQPDEHPPMHWGSELSIELVGTGATFVLRFPRLLQGADGRWRLAAAPAIDARFRTFRALGLDLKPELLAFDQHPFPLTVGSYWHYRTRRPLSGDPTAEGTGRGLITPDGFRDEVVRLDEFPSYRVAHLRRLFDNPARSSEYFSYLVTPLRVYPCDRECQRRAGEMDWLLSWAQSRTPLLAFPLTPGLGWGAGGLDGRTNIYRVQPESTDVEVPAGTFTGAMEIVRATARGRESIAFVPSVGTVMRRSSTGSATDIEELIEYRILP
jgi:hypothetical protein